MKQVGKRDSSLGKERYFLRWTDAPEVCTAGATSAAEIRTECRRGGFPLLVR